MSSGEQTMCSPQPLGKYLTSATLGEINFREYRLEEIFHIQQVDENQYGGMLEYLINVTYKGRYE